jgi:hypothetical protein
MPVMGVAADISAVGAAAEKPVWVEEADRPEQGAAVAADMPAVEAVDMPERVVVEEAAGEPTAVESLSSVGFDKPGQRSDYMTEPLPLVAGLLASIFGSPGAEPRLRAVEERRILPLPQAFSGDPGREQTFALSAEGV